MTDQHEPETPTKRIAAIDLGTNSFHAVIVDIYPDGSFRTIDKLKEMVILAEKGMVNHLSEGAMERGLDALKRIKFLCDSQGVEQILAYATSAIREAKNGGDFIQEVLDETGIKVRAISGKMEAKMIGTAIRHSISMSEEMVLMVDIGGGSVEFVIGNKNEFVHFSSLKLGVARMAAIFIEKDPIAKKELKALQEHFKNELIEVGSIVKDHKVKTLIGSSGTMENIAAMIAARSSNTPVTTLNEYEIDRKDYKAFYKDFIKLNAEQRAGEKGLDEKRIDIINPGLVLVDFLLNQFEIENIKISEEALRDGMILNYINEEKEKPGLQLVSTYPDPRQRSIYELLRKCNWPEKHSKHVTEMGLQLFDVLCKELKLEQEDRELFEYACLMHDIGYYISYRKHHKHSMYLIKNSDLRGFREEEINLMAHVARYHRRSVPGKKHFAYKNLDKSLRIRINKLSGILRVADGLDRSHFQNVVNFEILNEKKQITIYITTESDPELEIWGATRKSHLFEKVTGKTLEIISVEEKVKTQKLK